MSLAAKPMLGRDVRHLDWVERALLWVLMGACLLMAAGSWSWRVNHDFALLSYTGFLMEHHAAVPYRDIFETSMPGTFVFHGLLERVVGHSDVAFRLVNLLILGVLNLITWRVLEPCGNRARCWAVTLFDVMYLSQGQSVSLQRDYLGVLPVALALTWLPRRSSEVSSLGDVAVVGFLFGLASTFKPHLAIAWPFLLWLQVVSRAPTSVWRDGVRCMAVSFTSLLLPWVAALSWLWAQGALTDFAELLFDYLPLHNAFNGQHVVMAAGERLRYLLGNACAIGGYGPTFFVGLLACAIGYQRCLVSGVSRSLVMGIAGCILAYAVYPVIAGKFWDYHYLPLAYFISLGMAMAFIPEAGGTPGPGADEASLRIAMTWLTALAVTLQSVLPVGVIRAAMDVRAVLSGQERHAPADGRADEIAAFLRAHMHPGDTVQPLDWTGGVILGLLLAEAPLATRYMYDYHFYHHVSSAQNQKLRADFLRRLESSRPRFVIEVPGDEKPWVTGVDTSRSFEPLHVWLDRHYRVRLQRSAYVIFERAN